MAVTLTTLESNLQTKLNATSGTTDAQEFLLLSKSVEALNPSIAVQDVIDEGTTQVAAVTSAGTTQIGLVQAEGATQVAAVQAAGSGYATQADIDASVSALVDSAPATLDTLNELAAALGDDANFSTTVTNSIATKLSTSGGTVTGGVVVRQADSTKGTSFTTLGSIELWRDDSVPYIDFKTTSSEDYDCRIQQQNDGLEFSVGGDGSTFTPLVLLSTGEILLRDNTSTTKLRVHSTGAAVTGDLSVSGNVSGNYTSLHPEVTSTSAAATSQTFDMNDPMTHMTMTAATSFTATNLAAGKTSMMVLDTTASAYTPSWNADIKWPDATEPTWADYRYWIVSFTCLNGTTTLASASGYTV